MIPKSAKCALGTQARSKWCIRCGAIKQRWTFTRLRRSEVPTTGGRHRDSGGVTRTRRYAGADNVSFDFRA